MLEKKKPDSTATWLADRQKWTYNTRVAHNGSNLTLKTLFNIVGKGLGGKVNITIGI
jgi:hypothetical protein